MRADPANRHGKCRRRFRSQCVANLPIRARHRADFATPINNLGEVVVSACELSNEKLFARDVIVPGIRNDQRRDIMHRWILLAVALMPCCVATPAGAADILLVSPGAMSSSLKELIPRFEQSSGHKVTV